MRFNGVDLAAVHRTLSICKEIPPGLAGRKVHTVRGNASEMLAGYQEENGIYKVEVNIAARSMQEAWQVRALLAGWAASSGEKTGEIEPTHWTGKVYDGIVSSISPPRFSPCFATVDVEFVLPDAHARDAFISRSENRMQIGGTAACKPILTHRMAARADGLTISMDGRPILGIDGTLEAGSVIEADFGAGTLEVDHVPSLSRLRVRDTHWRPGFLPGVHQITATDAGGTEARWHNRWM